MAGQVRNDDVHTAIASATLTGFHWRIFLLCGLVALMDGFDSGIIGLTASPMAHAYHMDVARFGPIFAASQIGYMAGAFLSGPLADRYGRKLILGLFALFFAGCTLSTALAGNFQTLLVLRLMTGIGLGGGAANFVALCSDFTPARMRGAILTGLWAMLPAGNVLGGVLSAWMIPAYGWPSVYLFGGLVPGAAGLAILAFVPESISFLARKPANGKRIEATLRRLCPTMPFAGATYSPVDGARSERLPLLSLFQGDKGWVTIWIWIAFFGCWMCLQIVLAWIAPLAIRFGYNVSSASLLVATYSLGGMIGGLGTGLLMDRYDRFHVIGFALIVGAICVALTGLASSMFALLACGSFMMGLLIGGPSAGIVTLAATSYESRLRSTAIGWGIAVARVGGAIGPMLAGMALTGGIEPKPLFVLVGIPGLISGLAVLALRGQRLDSMSQGPEPAPRVAASH